jgi:hypothetical protein
MGRILLYLCYLQILVDAGSLKAAQLLETKPLDTTLVLIAKEGLACFEMAAAIPRLATLNGMHSDIFLSPTKQFILSIGVNNSINQGWTLQLSIGFVPCVTIV